MASARHGGAIYNYTSSPILTNCVLYKNEAGCFGDGICNQNFSDPVISNCILWSYDGANTPDVLYDGGNSVSVITYSIVQGAAVDPGNHISDQNPIFLDPDNGDFRVDSGSPCIDAGVNATLAVDTVDIDNDTDTTEIIPYDIACKARVFNYECNGAKLVDIGPYEYTSAKYGDLDGDCDVDMDDFAMLSHFWCTKNQTVDIYPGLAGPENIIVNLDDLAIFIENWLTGI